MNDYFKKRISNLFLNIRNRNSSSGCNDGSIAFEIYLLLFFFNKEFIFREILRRQRHKACLVGMLLT